MLVVAFQCGRLTLRGTEIAVYDYAHYNETILGNKSLIFAQDPSLVKKDYDFDLQAYHKFSSRFEMYYYYTHQDVQHLVIDHEVTHLYHIIHGQLPLTPLCFHCKNIVHCVFDSRFPHGDTFTVVGQTVNDNHHTSYPVTPHMITLPPCETDLRQELQIPKEALVFGRYGGKDSFDIPWVYQVIQQVIHERSDIYFLFMNTFPFYSHPQIIYLEGSADLIHKRKFINTCDSLIHSRQSGESFGLACGEFAFCLKPVITFGQSPEREHLSILREKAVIYNNPNELYIILSTFTPTKYNMQNNGYLWYTPENVMAIFQKNCLT